MRFAFLIAAATCVFGQPASQKMIDASVHVFGVIQEDGKPKPVSLHGGFLVDSKHVVTTSGCCDKTKEGAQQSPFVKLGEDYVPAEVAWVGGDQIVILEVKKEAKASALTYVPANIMQQGQAIYTVQIPQKGDAAVGEGKLVDVLKNDKIPFPFFKLTPTTDSVEMGSALFDACGYVAGINLVNEKGDQFAFVIDPLLEGLKKVGVAGSVADKPCGGAKSSTKNTKPATKPDSKEDKKGEETEEGSGWRLPKGPEWIGVAIVAGLAVLALRKATRPTVAAISTMSMPVPQAPVVAPPFRPVQMVPPPTKPVLRGVSGQYAGATIPLENAILGRDPHSANLVFSSEADSISKRHCSVRWDAVRGVFVIEDLGSTNGTFLASGERLTSGQPRELRPGDRFYIGDLRNQFEVGLES